MGGAQPAPPNWLCSIIVSRPGPMTNLVAKSVRKGQILVAGKVRNSRRINLRFNEEIGGWLTAVCMSNQHSCYVGYEWLEKWRILPRSNQDAVHLSESKHHLMRLPPSVASNLIQPSRLRPSQVHPYSVSSIPLLAPMLTFLHTG